MEQPNKISDSNEFPKAGQEEIQESQNMEVDQPPLQESRSHNTPDDRPSELLENETHLEFLARVSSWVQSAQQQAQVEKQITILTSTEFTEFVDQERKNSRRSRQHTDHSRVVKRNWLKRRKELRLRREQELKKLHSTCKSQLNRSQSNATSNQTSNLSPPATVDEQFLSFSNAQLSFAQFRNAAAEEMDDSTNYNLPQFSQHRGNKRKSLTKSVTSQSKQPRLGNHSLAPISGDDSNEEPTTESKAEYLCTSHSQSRQNLVSDSEHGYSGDESSMEDITSTIDSLLSLTYLWADWNLPSPKEENLINHSSSSDEGSF